MTVIDLANHRPPVCYTVRLTEHWDGRLEIFVEDVADDDRSRRAVADSLRRAADQLSTPRSETAHSEDVMTRARYLLYPSAFTDAALEQLAEIRERSESRHWHDKEILDLVQFAFKYNLKIDAAPARS